MPILTCNELHLSIIPIAPLSAALETSLPFGSWESDHVEHAPCTTLETEVPSLSSCLLAQPHHHSEGSVPSKRFLVGLLVCRLLGVAPGIVGIILPLMSRSSGEDNIDYGLFKNRVDGVLVEYVTGTHTHAHTLRPPPRTPLLSTPMYPHLLPINTPPV